MAEAATSKEDFDTRELPSLPLLPVPAAGEPVEAGAAAPADFHTVTAGLDGVAEDAGLVEAAGNAGAETTGAELAGAVAPAGAETVGATAGGILLARTAGAVPVTPSTPACAGAAFGPAIARAVSPEAVWLKAGCGPITLPALGLPAARLPNNTETPASETAATEPDPAEGVATVAGPGSRESGGTVSAIWVAAGI